jgi:hypothetical protein
VVKLEFLLFHVDILFYVLLISRISGLGLLRGAHGVHALFSLFALRVPERRFPLLSGWVSYSYLFGETWSIFSAKNNYILVGE